jgi:hypothetical protein
MSKAPAYSDRSEAQGATHPTGAAVGTGAPADDGGSQVAQTSGRLALARALFAVREAIGALGPHEYADGVRALEDLLDSLAPPAPDPAAPPMPRRPLPLREARFRRGNPGAFVLTFGKHRGRTLAHAADLEPGYVAWLAGLDHGEPAKAARCFLRSRSADPGTRPPAPAAWGAPAARLDQPPWED